MKLRERARCGYPDAMAALAEAGEDLSFLSAEQRAYGWCHTFHPRLASLIVESDGSYQVVPSRVVLLDDERVLCTNDWKIWDGRMLRPLPRPEAASFQIDPRGARPVTEKEGFTALVRLGDRLPYRQLPGTLLALHPTEPYLATGLEGEICIWQVPHEVELGPAVLEDNAERLEPHLRPLGLFLLQRRFRHEVSLEEGLELSPAHDIQLDCDSIARWS